MPAILFDIDGVLYEGDRPIPGAAETIEWCIANSIPHLFLTNTSSRPRSALVTKLAGFGIQTAADDFLTPPVATVSWLKQNNITSIALFIPEATREEFADFDILSSESNHKVDAVIIGDMGAQWDFTTLNNAFRLLINNPEAKLIALGMTRYWRADDGLRLDAGPYVSALQYATDCKPVVLGKPAVTFYQAALKLLKQEDKNTVMVGDDIKGDIEAAQFAGIRAILVKTGKFKTEDLQSGINPDAVIQSIAELPEWWQAHSS